VAGQVRGRDDGRGAPVVCAFPTSNREHHKRETMMELKDEVRRVVTGHDETGKAIVLIDGPTPYKNVRPGSGTAGRLLWVTDRSPADMKGSADRAGVKVGIAPPPGGSIFRTVDFPSMTDEDAKLGTDFMQAQISHGDQGSSKYRAPTHPFMHRTQSIDYAIVMAGEIDMLLDDGREIHLKAGDVLVQQGTNHAWINRGGKPCRIAFILIDAADPMA
jgi:Cupin domain